MAMIRNRDEENVVPRQDTLLRQIIEVSRVTGSCDNATF
jgi:hypothetical protein